MKRNNYTSTSAVMLGIAASLIFPRLALGDSSLFLADQYAYTITYVHMKDTDVLSIQYDFENPFVQIVELDAEAMGEFIEKSYAFQLKADRIYPLSCTTAYWDKKSGFFIETCEASFNAGFFPKQASLLNKMKIMATQMATTDNLAKLLTSDAVKQASIKDILAKQPLTLSSPELSIKDATEDTYADAEIADTDTPDSTSTTPNAKTALSDNSISALIAAGGDGCSLTGGAPANPLIFLLIGLALLPIARRR